MGTLKIKVTQFLYLLEEKTEAGQAGFLKTGLESVYMICHSSLIVELMMGVIIITQVVNLDCGLQGKASKSKYNPIDVSCLQLNTN